MAKRVLAFDFGASSGRAMLGTYDGGKLSLKEIHRFSNDPVSVGGTLYWDVLRLLFEIKQGITKALADGGFDSIGIDTWGVDFGLLDGSGRLLENPVHYRDVRTAEVFDELLQKVSAEELYSVTGIQLMRINTIFQLYYLSTRRQELMSRAKKMLFIPDLFAYFLTGAQKAEYTIASTSQMLDAKTGDWASQLLGKLGIFQELLPELIQPGETYGNLSPEICDELGCKSVPVIAVCTHDTASAVAAVPTQDKDFCYLSSGTWSLLGTELDAPVLSDAAQRSNITNEGGFGKTIRLLKNIMGLWLVQESRRQWAREGNQLSFAEIENLATVSTPFQSFIDPDDPSFELPGNLPERVAEYCIRTGQRVPGDVGQTAQAIYQSLALKYRYTVERLEELTGRKYACIQLVGGGGKDSYLCQMAANACKIKVLAGPSEATAFGNAGVQLLALGQFNSLKEVRASIERSISLKEYTPKDGELWDEAYEQFKAVTGLSRKQ